MREESERKSDYELKEVSTGRKETQGLLRFERTETDSQRERAAVTNETTRGQGQRG